MFATIVATGATTVEVVGRQLVVDGSPFHMKGVCWNPVPTGGTHPEDLNFAGFVVSDAEIMASAGINAVRTYEPINDTRVLDELWKHNIHVLNTVYVSGANPVESAVSHVKTVKDHPSILMWVVGNEWNYNGLYYGLPLEESQERVRQAVALIKGEDPNHPVATVHGELPSPEMLTALDNVDIWGINKYDGDSFGNMFAAWAELSQLPMFLGEYGADAWNTDEDKEDEQAQADATVRLTREIIDESSADKDGVCIGGIIFEFADEWWKDGNGNPAKQDIGGVSPGGGPYPDRTFNEEWWGLVHQDGTPREAFNAYASIEVPGGVAFDAARLAGVSGAEPPLRERACGAHLACRGLFGSCCPAENGTRAACCDSSSTRKPPEQEGGSSTTWRPPKEEQKPQKPKGDEGDEAGQGDAAAHEYSQEQGQFANGHFKSDLPGCQGMGECQFRTRQEAQRWCDGQQACTVVLLHPFEDNCAGGLGCYTPRFGDVASNPLWTRSGGKSWVKGARKEGAVFVATPAPKNFEYTFVGFMEADKAEEACAFHDAVPAMPKDRSQVEALLQAMDAAQSAGKMSKTWPKNTIWLGGRWNADEATWQWFDGSNIDRPSWAPGQPSSADAQESEPWLCLMDVAGGGMHDSEVGEPPYAFGVMCEMPSEGGGSSGEPELERPLMGAAAEAMDDAEAEEVEQESEHVADAEASDIDRAPAPAIYGSYEFVGFFGPADARGACGEDRFLAMPKTKEMEEELSLALDNAMTDGKLKPDWPGNTIWLGAQWDPNKEIWQWDDGSAIDTSQVKWGDGQPSGTGHQADEPWLCMVHEPGSRRPVLHDSETGPPFSFGVMCHAAEAAPAEQGGDEEDNEEQKGEAGDQEAVPESPSPAMFEGATPGPATELTPAPTPVPTPAQTEAPKPEPRVPAPGEEEQQTDDDDGEKQEQGSAPAPAEASEDGAGTGAYQFVGWETPEKARSACGKHGRLAMPRSDAQKREVLQAIKDAIVEGDMEDYWPKNAVWLAGKYDAASEQWLWDDGQEIPQLAGSKAAELDSARLPWLCVSADGQARAWDNDKLGVLCELVSGGDSSSSLRGLEVVHAQDAGAWVRAPTATDCHEACAGRGLACVEDRWPRSRRELERVVLPAVSGGAPCDTIQSGGHRYDPSASGRHCGWEGPERWSEWHGQRCGARAPRGAQRFCPCAGVATSTPTPGPAIWS